MHCFTTIRYNTRSLPAWTIRITERFADTISIPDEGKRFILLDIVQTGCGVHTVSYSMGNGYSLSGIKRTRLETRHLHQCGSEVKNEWKCTSASVICLHGMDRVKVKVKVKLSLEQATKAQRGSRGIALLFL
jgi:hypothetical protein